MASARNTKLRIRVYGSVKDSSELIKDAQATFINAGLEVDGRFTGPINPDGQDSLVVLCEDKVQPLSQPVHCPVVYWVFTKGTGLPSQLNEIRINTVKHLFLYPDEKKTLKLNSEPEKRAETLAALTIMITRNMISKYHQLYSSEAKNIGPLTQQYAAVTGGQKPVTTVAGVVEQRLGLTQTGVPYSADLPDKFAVHCVPTSGSSDVKHTADFIAENLGVRAANSPDVAHVVLLVIPDTLGYAASHEFASLYKKYASKAVIVCALDVNTNATLLMIEWSNYPVIWVDKVKDMKQYIATSMPLIQQNMESLFPLARAYAAFHDRDNLNPDKIMNDIAKAIKSMHV